MNFSIMADRKQTVLLTLKNDRQTDRTKPV